MLIHNSKSNITSSKLILIKAVFLTKTKQNISIVDKLWDEIQNWSEQKLVNDLFFKNKLGMQSLLLIVAKQLTNNECDNLDETDLFGFFSRPISKNASDFYTIDEILFELIDLYRILDQKVVNYLNFQVANLN